MVKQDLIESSPVRFFDSITNGGLKAGQMGLITAKKGLGKTSVLVQFGIDSLIQDKHLVHISFDQHSSNVISWYDSILAEIGKKKNLGNINELTDTIVRDRTILNFNQENFTLPKVVATIKALKEGGFPVAAIVIDGADLKNLKAEDIKAVHEFTTKEKITCWFSDTNENGELKNTISSDKEPFFDTVAHLENNGNTVLLKVLKSDGKASEESIKLDSKTLLMGKKD